MRDEPDYAEDARDIECWQCAKVMSVGWRLNGHVVCDRCYHDSPEVQHAIEEDRKADEQADDEDYGYGFGI